MITRGFGQHPRVFVGLLLTVLVALAVGVAQGLAGTGKATAPLKKHIICGVDTGASAIGSVTLTREDKTTLREHVRLTKFTPSTKYVVFLFSGGCDPLAKLGKLKTDSSGAGDATFTSSTFGYESFFVLVDCPCPGWGASVTVKVDG